MAAKLIPQSTTSDPLFFFMVQSADHITALAGASPTVTISKNGAAFGSPAGSVTEIANGWYQVAGNATDTATLGEILLHATAASGDPCDMTVGQVVAFNPRDGIRLNLTALPNAAANAAGGLPISIAGALDLDEMNVDIEAIQTSTAGLTFTGAGKVDASVRDWIGGTIPAVNVTGVPLVDLKYTLGTISPATAGSVRADAVTGAVGSVTAAVTLPSIPSNWITAAGIADAAIDRATFAVDTGLQNIRANTAQAGAATTITLDASASATNSFYNNDLIYITGGTGVGQARFITAYVGATKVATVGTWATNPDATTTFAILPFDAVAGATAPTVAQIATGVWQDTTAGDFTVASSIGKSLYTTGNAPGAASGLALVGSNMGTITGALTAAQIATGIWQDATAGDFTVASSIGKSVMNGVALGTGLTINQLMTNNDKTGYSLTQSFPSNFSSLSIDGSGNVAITSNVKKNTASAGFTFVMRDSTAHAPATGLTVTATRSIDGAAFGACTNAAAELSNGWYKIDLSAADVNGNHIALKFTAAASDDTDLEIITQP